MLGNIVERERERERVINNNVGLKPTLIMFFALVAIVGIILYCGFQNIANATPDDVTFNPVTIRNGAKIHVNGDKTLTAIDNGNKLFADNTNGTPVKGNQIESELNSFASNNYGDDALFKSSAANNPSSLSEAELNAFRQYLPTVDNDYWLSDIGSIGSISWQAISKFDNTLYSKSLTATGFIDGTEYYNSELISGSFAFNKTLMLQPYSTTRGARFSFSNNEIIDFTGTYVAHSFGVGTTVYNNPYCYTSGSGSNGYSYRSTTLQKSQNGTNSFIFGYVSSGNNILKVQGGIKLKAGTVVLRGFIPSENELYNPSGFLMPPASKWDSFWGPRMYTGFMKLTADVTLNSGSSAGHQRLYGFTNYYDRTETVNPVSIVSSQMSVRPVYDAGGRLKFFRNSSNGVFLDTSSSFRNSYATYAEYGEHKKAVVASDEVSISNDIDENKLSTEKSIGNHAETKYEDSAIKVPYCSKKLTIQSGAFSTKNANYISALANVNGTQKYAVLGKVGDDIEVDLSSIVNVSQVGSKATVSFFAEQPNPANTSDVISETPVTVEIEVVEGPEQTIRYDLGGGTGNLPSNATVKAGKSYTLADALGLNKDGNPFSCWQVSYTDYGELTQTDLFFKCNETIVVPDTNNGVVSLTAIYGGIKASKSTDSQSSVLTITWDTNAPDGCSASFTGEAGIGSSFNADKSIRYDKIKIAGSKIAVPEKPNLNVTSKVFDGWYTQKIGGTKISDLTISPTEDTTYYAHWIDGFKVTYDASGLFDGGIPGNFNLSDGTTISIIEEIVLPGRRLQGPHIGSDIAVPSAKDTANPYAFIGWFSEPNGGGTEAQFGITEVTQNKTYYAYFISGYKITYDATGGEGSSMTGKFVAKDGSSRSSVYEIVLPGNKTKGPKLDDVDIDPVANDSNNEGYGFDGWYEQPNGAGDLFSVGETVTGDKTYYAYYVSGNTFLAPVSNQANAKEIDPTRPKYSLNYVKRAAQDIANNATGSYYYTKFYNWMIDENNYYHMYSLLNNTDEKKTASWVQSRIVEVGQHDSDGTGLTFQATHMLPQAYTADGSNWADCDLKKQMQYGGKIYNLFDTNLSREIKVWNSNVGTYWIASYSELTGLTDTEHRFLRNQFTFYKIKGVGTVSTLRSDLLSLTTRDGNSASSSSERNGWWQRTNKSSLMSSDFAVVLSGGYFTILRSNNNYYGVVPCFAL